MDEKTKIIYEKITQVAKGGGITHYSDIAPLVGLSMDSPGDRTIMSTILDKISMSEHENAKPLLSAVVILKEKNIPGDGFFTMAQGVGLYDGIDEVQFWVKELRRVHDYWTRQE